MKPIVCSLKPIVFLIFSLLWAICYWLYDPAAMAAEDWLEGANGYARGIDQAQSSGKPMLLYFYTDWCPYCRKFEKNTLAREDVQKNLTRFIYVRINPEKGSRENELASQYRVDGYPSVFFVGPGGVPKTREVTSLTRSVNDFMKAASEFSKVIQVQKSNVAPVVAAEKPAIEKKELPDAAAPDHVLYLKNGRILKGCLISRDQQGATLALQDLGEVYFSNSEFERLEQI